MGTRWSALFYAPQATDLEPVRSAIAECVDLVDRQMSTWKPDSDLMRINRALVGDWTPVPAELMEVLAHGLEIGKRSNGAFDIGMGRIVTAWGFGPNDADVKAIRAFLGAAHCPAHDALEFAADMRRVRKHTQIALDLSGIAKGYAVDRMMAELRRFGINDALVGLDGEMRACGQHPDGRPWTIALEKPDYEKREPHSIIELVDHAVATSGDYRHWVEVGKRRLSHTMDPTRCGPLSKSPASVTVLADDCIDADAWATALMVLGSQKGADLARKLGLKVIFLDREGENLRLSRVG